MFSKAFRPLMETPERTQHHLNPWSVKLCGSHRGRLSGATRNYEEKHENIIISVKSTKAHTDKVLYSINLLLLLLTATRKNNPRKNAYRTSLSFKTTTITITITIRWVSNFYPLRYPTTLDPFSLDTEACSTSIDTK
jgi:hypothetical protein